MRSELELPAALDSLYSAVGRLCEQRKEFHQGVMRVGPSLYETLLSEIPRGKSRGETFISGAASSRPLVWCDAVDLRKTIDGTVRRWAPGATTPDRLRAVAAKRYRPQDVELVADRAALIGSWAVSIKNLIEPEPVKTISAACPACGVDRVYRDYAGERVRQPALQITSAGCTCAACHAVWTPDRYVFLCRLLGFDLPAGVLD